MRNVREPQGRLRQYEGARFRGTKATHVVCYVMNVIDRLGRVSRLDQMRHKRLDGWRRDVAECQLAKPRNQVLREDGLTMISLFMIVYGDAP